MKYNESQRGKMPQGRNDRRANVREHHGRILVEYGEWVRERCKLYKLGGKRKRVKKKHRRNHEWLYKGGYSLKLALLQPFRQAREHQDPNSR